MGHIGRALTEREDERPARVRRAGSHLDGALAGGRVGQHQQRTGEARRRARDWLERGSSPELGSRLVALPKTAVLVQNFYLDLIS